MGIGKGLIWSSGRKRRLTADSIAAFHIAGGGAMGEGGAVNIFCDKKGEPDTAYGNYVYGNFNLDDFLELVEKHGPLDFQKEGMCSPEGWGHFYLGFGNHLFTRKDLYKNLYEKYKDMSEPERYFAYGKDIEDYLQQMFSHRQSKSSRL